MTHRIARRVDDDDARLRADRALQLLRRDLESVAFLSADELWNPTGEFYLLWVTHPIRRGDDHFVARVQNGHECHVEAMLSAGAKRDLLGLVGKTVVGVKLSRDCLS